MSTQEIARAIEACIPMEIDADPLVVVDAWGDDWGTTVPLTAADPLFTQLMGEDDAAAIPEEILDS
jgi:hypothetical protein